MRSRRCCHYQISYSAWVLKESGHSQVWEPSQCWVSVLVAVLPLVWEVARLSGSGFQLGASLVKSLRLGDILGRQGEIRRWLGGMGIAGYGWEAEGNPFLAIVLDLIFSKRWAVNATCDYKSCWIFCHETTNEFDSHHIHQLVEQIYPSFLNLSLSEWDFTHG